MKKILLIFGTRPEAIKLAPLAHVLRQTPDVDCRICLTAQHREMLDQVMTFFDLKADWDLDLMVPGQSLAGLTARILEKLGPVLDEFSPDQIVVQGDTTTSMAGALVAFYHQVSVCHVEAGLRTGNKRSPFPEEVNRRLTSVMADLHCAPTESNRQALLKEGIPSTAISVTGNTVVDALLLARDRVSSAVPEKLRDLNEKMGDKRLLLVTGHRRESFGDGFEQICLALQKVATAFPDLRIVYPVHLNPRVQEPVNRLLSDIPNVQLIEPLAYPEFVWMMNRSYVILTDSGGVQEEAPSLGKPVLVMRDTTEREEGVRAGTAKLVGAHADTIVKEVTRLLTDEAAWMEMSTASNPYGDGKACERIVKAILEFPHAG
ncbi:UDP-N-acetylglucosamine 2-epimerase (non-hydrolyzing) [Kiritimatiellota bacterium B12222]|nr:UDP-N-acetylglucosamine 2-epimerase (non-hydrolyzing) [Kiritimatiellota bacterium B12222]